MRGSELKTFILPGLVEARKRGEGDMRSPTSARHAHQLSRSSTQSDATTPATPTFSTCGHSRLSSSTSSLASSPTMRESTDGFSAKRPLTDVREEPQDKDEDHEMLNAFEERRSYDGKYNETSRLRVQCLHLIRRGSLDHVQRRLGALRTDWPGILHCIRPHRRASGYRICAKPLR